MTCVMCLSRSSWYSSSSLLMAPMVSTAIGADSLELLKVRFTYYVQNVVLLTGSRSFQCGSYF